MCKPNKGVQTLAISRRAAWKRAWSVSPVSRVVWPVGMRKMRSEMGIRVMYSSADVYKMQLTKHSAVIVQKYQEVCGAAAEYLHTKCL